MVYLEVNTQEARKKCPEFERERWTKNPGAISYCSHCKRFIGKRFWASHLKTYRPNSAKKILPIPIELLDPANGDELFTEDFKQKVLSKFRADEIGTLCLQDPSIAGSQILPKR